MKILLDHCVDWRLSRSLPGHEVRNARQMGWDELENGELLAAAAAQQFHVLLTVDQNIESQQNLAALPVAIIVVITPSNKLDALTPLVPAIESALAGIQPCTLVKVSAS